MGCDLRIGSNKTIDSCGVCGGQNRCTRTAFSWKETPLSHCSSPCGGGHMMVRSVCINNQTSEQVHEDHCIRKERPLPRMAPCNSHACPARWEVEDWGTCSKSCGGGFRARKVSCVSDKAGRRIKVRVVPSIHFTCPKTKSVLM